MLAPSLTEIAFAQGCGDKIIADTTYDDYPASARALPHVADLVNVDLERLSALRPSIVVALHDQEREGGPIESRLHVPVVYLPNRTLNDMFEDIASVGAICGTQSGAAALDRSLHARLAAISQQARRYSSHPKVFFLLDVPGFTVGAGSFLGDLIALAGGINAAGSVHEPYPNVSAEALLAMNPDVLIIAHDVRINQAMLRQPPWRSLNAVQNGRVLRPPSDDILERNGPRIVDGLQWLVHAIHS
jgi:ABC-type Fe3+-hydroxamate transport system substrate-binding protein